MAHRALTLKYRPQVFDDVIGQDHVSSVLSRALEGGRVAQAYLFAGARGVGKTTSARILAKALNCEKRAAGQIQGPDPCNTCTSCTEITSGVSLDVAEIDGASNRGIADVQALREKVRFTPTGGSYRVVIIDEVHQLSGDAFAALLKTLEEPPPHLVFIFATTDPQKLPETIRSRTQRFDFARVPLRKIADRLLAIADRERADPEGVQFTLADGAALLIAHQSEGSMRDAVSALDQVVSAGEPGVDEALVRRVLGLPDQEAFFAIAEAIVKRDPKAALHALHRAFEKGLDARDLAEGLSEHVRHILILKVDPQGADLVAAGGEDLARLKAMGEGWSEADLLRLLRLASEASWPMRDSPQPLIHLEAAVLQMATLEPGETLAELLERLEQLERRLGGAGAAGKREAPAGGGPALASAAATRPAASAPGSAARAPWSAGTPPAAPTGSTRASAPAAAPARSTGPGAGSAFGAAGRATATSATTAPSATSATTAPAAPSPTTAPTATIEARAAGDPPQADPEAVARWRATIVAVNGRKRMLGAFLEESRLVGASPATLDLATDELHRTVIDEQENRAIVAEELERAFGRPLRLRCVPPDAQALPSRPSEADLKPLIDRAIAWFEGDIIERTDRGSERTQ
ncbi:MAG: DNA polymerase III, subunit gamma and tau [Candidatus Eisenbacteria bacterium RBG_16_71_46]|nr:MAG: DNA polymerase III, subunit gamma and tau [Candidatus Eisenbacteria bacterium RBG_16_71_46]